MKTNLSQKIKFLREKADISPTELATKAKLSPAFISKLENGEYETLSLKTSKHLSEGLGITLRYFLEEMGIIESNHSEPRFLSVSQALRSEGLSEEQAKQVISYADYLKSKHAKHQQTDISGEKDL